MKKNLTKILPTALLISGDIAFALVAQPNSSRSQGEDSPPQLDLASAAITLNATEGALIAALGLPADRPEGGQGQGALRMEDDTRGIWS